MGFGMRPGAKAPTVSFAAVLLHVILAILATGLLASMAAGQTTFDREPSEEGTIFNTTPLRDGNRFIFGGGLPDPQELQFEAQIAGDVPIWGQRGLQTLADRVLRSHSPFRRRWSHQGYATALLRLRMIDAPSAPVAPPSFMPKLTIQGIGFKRHSRSKASMILVNGVPYGHHSNGQAGCALQGQSGESCLPLIDPPQGNPNPPINVDTGSFSTNYIRAGLYYRQMYLSEEDTVRTELTAGGAVERHVGFWPYSKGSLSDDFESRYGRTRLRFTLGAAVNNSDVFDRIDIRYHGQIILGVAGDRYINVLETLMFFKGRPDLGLYYRVYTGRDYYNINFEEYIRKIEVGATFSWESIIRALPGPP